MRAQEISLKQTAYELSEKLQELYVNFDSVKLYKHGGMAVYDKNGYTIDEY